MVSMATRYKGPQHLILCRAQLEHSLQLVPMRHLMRAHHRLLRSPRHLELGPHSFLEGFGRTVMIVGSEWECLNLTPDHLQCGMLGEFLLRLSYSL